MPAHLTVLYSRHAGERVASTLVLVRDRDAVIVVDPDMVARRAQILGSAEGLAVSPDEITDMAFIHHPTTR